MSSITEQAIRDVWDAQRARFNPRVGYLRVPVSIRPPFSFPIGPGMAPELSEISSHVLEFTLTYVGSDYLIRCNDIEVERGPASMVASL